MTPDVKIEPTEPLSSAALEEDARKAGVDADQSTSKNGDTHVPASESEQAEHEGSSDDEIEQDVINLPPG